METVLNIPVLSIFNGGSLASTTRKLPHLFNYSLYYQPRKREGNVFSRVCMSVCLSVCPDVRALPFERLELGTSFLVYRYVFKISGSSSYIKVIGSRSVSRSRSILSFGQ